VSRHAAIELDYGDGTHTFRLGLDEIEELEEKLDLSIFALERRLSPLVRDPRLRDIRETLRCGLIGGGMKPVDALVLVRRYVDVRPLDESRDVAYAVILAALARVHPGELGEGDSPGEEQAAEPNGSTSPPSSPAPPSSE
jgi:hypothetical protein